MTETKTVYDAMTDAVRAQYPDLEPPLADQVLNQYDDCGRSAAIQAFAATLPAPPSPEIQAIETALLELRGQTFDRELTCDARREVANREIGALAEQVAELRRQIDKSDIFHVGNAKQLEDRIATIERHNADTDLRAPLSGSLVLVELRRIADALETLSSVVYAEDSFKHQREIKVGSWSGAEPATEPQPCDCAAPDCDELWRLTREYVGSAYGRSAKSYGEAGSALHAFVREHTP